MQAAVSNIADRHEVVEALKDPKDRCMYGVWGNVLDLLLHHLIPGLANDSPQLLGHCTALVGALILQLQNGSTCMLDMQCLRCHNLVCHCLPSSNLVAPAC